MKFPPAGIRRMRFNDPPVNFDQRCSANPLISHVRAIKRAREREVRQGNGREESGNRSVECESDCRPPTLSNANKRSGNSVQIDSDCF